MIWVTGFDLDDNPVQWTELEGAVNAARRLLLGVDEPGEVAVVARMLIRIAGDTMPAPWEA